MSLPNKYVNEVIWIEYNMHDLLKVGEVISTCTFAIRVVKGTDASSSAMLSGSAVIDGSIVSQKLINGVKGNIYAIMATCPTDGGRTLCYEDQIEII